MAPCGETARLSGESSTAALGDSKIRLSVPPSPSGRNSHTWPAPALPPLVAAKYTAPLPHQHPSRRAKLAPPSAAPWLKTAVELVPGGFGFAILTQRTGRDAPTV